MSLAMDPIQFLTNLNFITSYYQSLNPYCGWSLWSKAALSEYFTPIAFGNTEINCHIFDQLWKFIRFSDQPCMCPEGMLSEAYQWQLIDDLTSPVHLYFVMDHQLLYLQ